MTKRKLQNALLLALMLVGAFLMGRFSNSASHSTFHDVRVLEITVPTSNPTRAGFSDHHDAEVTLIRDGEDELVIASGASGAPSVQVVVVTRDGRRASFTGTTFPK